MQVDQSGGALSTFGIILESDAKLPSVATIIAGEPVPGSWWGHSKGHTIYEAIEALQTHGDVVATKLVSGKITYVHRRLWPALLGVASSRGSWQMKGLSPLARSILKEVSEAGELRTDELPWIGSHTAKSPGEAVRELEKKLLVHSDEIHTATGAHAKRVESWEHWVGRVGFGEERMTSDRAKREIGNVVNGLNLQFEAKGRLPWKNT